MFNKLNKLLGTALFEHILVESFMDYCVYEDKLEETAQMLEAETFDEKFFEQVTPYVIKNIGIYAPELLNEVDDLGKDDIIRNDPANTNPKTGARPGKSNTGKGEAAPAPDPKPTPVPPTVRLIESLFYFDPKDQVISGDNKQVNIRIDPNPDGGGPKTSVFLCEVIAEGFRRAYEVLEEARCRKLTAAMHAARFAEMAKKK